MFKRLVVICCILLVPTIAAAQTPAGTTNYGEFWVGGQGGMLFAADSDVCGTAGAIAGYNFCMPYRQPWERYFGVAVDFAWNHFQFEPGNHARIDGDQFALSLLARLQYPLKGDERFTFGRFVPFLMFGPSIVWTNPDEGNNRTYRGDNRSDWGVLAEVGFEYFVIPHLSIGPSFRYRHIWLGTRSSHMDQYMLLGRLAYHF